MALDIKNNHWAYDLSKDVATKGEIFDEDVIRQSISNILSTSYGERVMNPTFGSRLPDMIFETINSAEAQDLMNDILDSIERFEKRIVIIRKDVKFTLLSSENRLQIFIPYIIIKQRIKSSFNKKIVI